MSEPPVTLRPAAPEDAHQILNFIRELADYEQLLHEVTADLEDIRRTLFGPRPEAEVVIAETNGTAVGFALYHAMYSTFLARSGLYLEDLYVQPAFRGRGIGRALLVHLAKLAVAGGHGRLDWSCLRWNEPSLAFYRALGAQEMEDWTRFRLAGDALEALARQAPAPKPRG
ncbi:MAG: GNAT family N-acetyltransferase [Xanthomonadales bacterium]|nr:GNAT family N-acetyltransferase [Xanthomonadales bacterium]